MSIQYLPATALTTQGNISYYIEIDNNAPSPSMLELPQQYKSQTHALYSNNQISYTDEELHQGLKRMHCRNETIRPDNIDEYDVGRFFYACSNVSTVSYGQFYVDIDASFYLPTLQNLTNDWVMQVTNGAFNPQTHKFPENDLLQYDASLTRSINGSLCNGYRVSQSGTLRFGIYFYGTNGLPTTRPIPAVASSMTENPSIGSIYT